MEYGEMATFSREAYARYQPQTYAQVPEGLQRAMVEAKVGRNGWAVMIALCRKVFADGSLGRASANEISRRCGLTRQQVARGLMDLRERGIIAPVILKDEDGVRYLDRPRFGHVAQYCITKDVWAAVRLEGDEAQSPE